MKKLFAAVLAVVFVLMLSGCDTQDETLSRIRSETNAERENSLREEAVSREAEIEDVDKWGVSLDDVDRLAKAAIRKHENVSEYKRDYNKAIRVTDEFLEDVESGKKDKYNLNDFLEKYKVSCETGIEYMRSCVNIEMSYNLYLQDGEFDKTEKNLIRFSLGMFNNSIAAIEQSQSDMEALLQPIIDEDRELTDDELEKVYEVYQVLTDKVSLAKYY